jgi:hypothetical protein
MPESIIIGIHGLLNKPEKDVLEKWWMEAIAEGLRRNCEAQLDSPFELVYWADIQYPSPIPVDELSERYEHAQGEGPLERYDPKTFDKIRAFTQKWGGRLLDKEKDLIGLGSNVEKLLGVGVNDLAKYYDSADKRKQMRARLSELLKQHNEERKVLIAHSMGSIIAYDVLRELDNRDMKSIEHFITIGSPLGLPIVTQKIRKEFGQTKTPENALRWTNIADPADKVALDCNLSDDYKKPSAAGVKVSDILVHNDYVNHEGEANNHKSYGYLRTPELSDLILAFNEQ